MRAATPLGVAGLLAACGPSVLPLDAGASADISAALLAPAPGGTVGFDGGSFAVIAVASSSAPPLTWDLSFDGDDLGGPDAQGPNWARWGVGANPSYGSGPGRITLSVSDAARATVTVTRAVLLRP